MKIYIMAVSIDDLRKQYPDIPQATFEQLVDLDPTANYQEGKRGKYGPWIMKQYSRGNFTRQDFSNLKDALQLFAKEYRHFPKSDLNRYATYEEFFQDSHAVGNRELTEKEEARRRKKAAHNAGDKDKELLVTDGVWQVWTPKTYAGSISLARWGGTQASWCTAYSGSDSYYRSYTAQGPLYIFINTADPEEKYQTHFETDCYMYDIDDNGGTEEEFYEFCHEHPKIGEFFEVKEANGVRTRGNSIIGYIRGASEIIIPDYITALPDLDFPSSCRKVVLPSTITVIPDGAFLDDNIETLVFDHLDEVDVSAFYDSKIRDIDFTKIDYVKSNAFRKCPNLTTLNLNPNGRYKAFAFADNPNLTGVVTILPTMLVSSGLFNNCPNLTVVWEDDDIPEGKFFDFLNIKKLVVDANRCPNLVASLTDPDTGETRVPISDRI